MSKKIQKINNLKKLEGFLQLNFSKGFKYVDKAGEFFNHFYNGDNFPKHVMDPTGMTVKIDEKTQLKVSPHHLWMHFVESDSFDYQSREFMNKAKLVNSIFEPEKYTRIGWRNYLVYECGETYPDIIPKDCIKGEFSEIVFTKKIKTFDSRISVSKLVKEGANTKAILFDIDIFKKQDINATDFNQIHTSLKNIENAYKSDELLEIVNDLLK
ncbi:MAG: hypothetical protein IT284_02235 [Bacteroidetes bacterium]|nr:hypothetical protein [Bacteroidota bacterium]